MLKRAGLGRKSAPLLAKRGLNSSPHPKKYVQGLPTPVRPQQENSPDQQPQSKREQHCADRRPREGGLGSGPGGARSAMPPPTPPECERAVPPQRGRSAHRVLQRTEKLYSFPAAHFPGVTIGLARAGLWFRASGGRTRDAS